MFCLSGQICVIVDIILLIGIWILAITSYWQVNYMLLISAELINQLLFLPFSIHGIQHFIISWGCSGDTSFLFYPIIYLNISLSMHSLKCLSVRQEDRRKTYFHFFLLSVFLSFFLVHFFLSVSSLPFFFILFFILHLDHSLSSLLSSNSLPSPLCQHPLHNPLLLSFSLERDSLPIPINNLWHIKLC